MAFAPSMGLRGTAPCAPARSRRAAATARPFQASGQRVGRQLSMVVRAEEAPAAAAPATPAKSTTEKTGPSFVALRDINQIMKTLPHR